MSDHEITHKEIYDRVVSLEQKVDSLHNNTSAVVAAFQAAQDDFLWTVTWPAQRGLVF